MMTLEKQETIKPERDELGRIKPGYSGNPAGRPKGKTLKEYAREWFLTMTDEEKKAYIIALEEKRPGFAWSQAEGNPEESKTVSITVPQPILGATSQDALPERQESEQIGRVIVDEALQDKAQDSQ